MSNKVAGAIAGIISAVSGAVSGSTDDSAKYARAQDLSRAADTETYQNTATRTENDTPSGQSK